MVRDECHLEDELRKLRALVGEDTVPRHLPTKDEVAALLAEWTEDVARALRWVRARD